MGNDDFKVGDKVKVPFIAGKIGTVVAVTEKAVKVSYYHRSGKSPWIAKSRMIGAKVNG